MVTTLTTVDTEITATAEPPMTHTAAITMAQTTTTDRPVHLRQAPTQAEIALLHHRAAAAQPAAVQVVAAAAAVVNFFSKTFVLHLWLTFYCLPLQFY